jgi:type VI protein secretion system component VasF
MNALLELCRPVFLCITNYRQLASNGEPLDGGAFRGEIVTLLSNAREESRLEVRLARDFDIIELPLVFFIDYMVKEGEFSFRDEWRELARGYNELSGDEKFFDLLSSALSMPDSENAALVFYAMLALGFDGVYGSNREYIRRCMDLAADKAGGFSFDPASETFLQQSLFTEDPVKKKWPRWLRPSFIAIAVSFVLLAAAFLVNLHVFNETTSDYSGILEKTALDSSPQFGAP